jgi:CDP-paratose 2-epimerase
MTLPRPNLRTVAPRVLVTGGCGFLGCNIAATLAARGDNVLVLDNLARAGADENAQWLKDRHGDRVAIEIADTRDENAVTAVVSEASAVLHLAAQVAVTTSVEHPREDFQINANGTLNILEAVRCHSPRAPVIFASTNKVYGKVLDERAVAVLGDRYVPTAERFAWGIGENAPLDLYSPYGCSKGAADQYVHDYARVFGLRTAVLRMSCIYGPRQFGNEDQGWIAHFLRQALLGDPITIYGDGCQVRDALYVDDAVAAWLGALDRIDQVSGRIFNLGGGPANTISLRELLRAIAELRGQPPAITYGDWRPGDQPWYVSDTRAIAGALDWSPRTSLRDGLRALDRWLVGRFAIPAPALREASA